MREGAENARMTVDLSSKAEAYVHELMRDGCFGNAEQVVDLLILKQPADDRATTMPNLLENLKNQLHRYAQMVYQKRESFDVDSTAFIDARVPSEPGVYWIETTMPPETIRSAISEVVGRNKRLRKSTPRGTRMIEQLGQELYVAYSGTEEDLRKRLKQHLFNQGHADTTKLGCVINEPPFSEYQWRISFTVINSYEFRYAVEACWRHCYGWPPFCRK